MGVSDPQQINRTRAECTERWEAIGAILIRYNGFFVFDSHQPKAVMHLACSNMTRPSASPVCRVIMTEVYYEIPIRCDTGLADHRQPRSPRTYRPWIKSSSQLMRRVTIRSLLGPRLRHNPSYRSPTSRYR